MRSEDLDRIFGATPQSFADRMDQTLLGLKEEKEVKRFAFRTVMVFALITVLLCTTAFALVTQGLEWYYNNRFTAYQEHEPEKHNAIMENLQTEVPQAPVNDPDVNISVAETSWSLEQNVLVVSLVASPVDPAATELHPMDHLDADGSYMGKDYPVEPGSEERNEHWLWTEAGHGPVAEMIAPGKQLLLLSGTNIYLDDIHLLGDMSSYDVYVSEDGAVHTVIEIRMEDFFDPAYADMAQEQIETYPDRADFWINRLAEVERFRQIINDDEDGVITLRIPYTVTAYSEDDDQLYYGGRDGEVQFELKIR